MIIKPELNAGLKPVFGSGYRWNPNHELNKRHYSWLLNERAGEIAHCSDSRATTNVGVAGWGPYGFLGAGSQYLESYFALFNSYPFTLAGRFASSYAGGTYQIILQIQDKDVTNTSWTIGLTDVYTAFMWARYGSINHNTSGLNVLNDGAVHTIVGIFLANNDRRLYVDGKRDTTSEDNTFVTYASADSFSIGRSGDSTPDNYFYGSIMLVEAWPFALTPQQVQYWHSWPFGTPDNPRLLFPSTRRYFYSNTGPAPSFNPAWAGRNRRVIGGGII